SLRATAHNYHVPYPRLHARFQNRPSKVGHPSTNKLLNEKQATALRLYIKRCNDLGFSALPHIIHDAATYILKSSNPDTATPIKPLGRDWVQRWL
ncbi:hypothetical protein K469DRAFT_457282, partial [Zopfia rhizophila CBS 207.26]